jgi:hypothetical protein
VPEGDTDESRRLITEFREAQEAAVVEIADQGLLSLAQLVETSAIDVAPKFQRRDRWDRDKQSRLIESFLTNIPVPPVYLAEDTARLGSYAVIDGKQRLTAISTFFADRLQLRGLTRLTSLNGYKYSTLPTALQTSLGMKNLRITTLLRQSSEDLKHEVFLRLNTGGKILNAQEIRNVAYHGPLNDLIYRLAENSFLRQQFKVIPPSSPAYRQMTDAEYVLRFLALSSNWKKFKGGLREELDRYMWTNRFMDAGALARLTRSFETSIRTAESVWGSAAFKRPGRDQALAGLYDAEMIALSELTESEQRKLIGRRSTARRLVSSLFDDLDFDEAVRLGTNTPSRLRYRTQEVLQALLNVSSDR